MKGIYLKGFVYRWWILGLILSLCVLFYRLDYLMADLATVGNGPLIWTNQRTLIEIFINGMITGLIIPAIIYLMSFYSPNEIPTKEIYIWNVGYMPIPIKEYRADQDRWDSMAKNPFEKEPIDITPGDQE